MNIYLFIRKIILLSQKKKYKANHNQTEKQKKEITLNTSTIILYLALCFELTNFNFLMISR